MQPHLNILWPVLVVCLSFPMRPTSATSSNRLQSGAQDMDLGIEHPLPSSTDAHKLILMPNSVEFPHTALYNVDSHAVTLVNNHNKTVYLTSVVALPAEGYMQTDFHVSFVRDQAVPPLGNITFTVIFLPTRIGPVATEISVRTTLGQLKTYVTGVGIASPFKVVALTNLVTYAGENSNSAVIPDVVLYNPYETTIQITEIFSSGGKFYLELPSDVEGDNAGLWTIDAYDRRAVIRVRFVGSAEAGNYSAYIRMKVKTVSLHSLEEIVLVIPIQMEVRPQQPMVLYPERSLINLGSVMLKEMRPLSINIHTTDTPDIGVETLIWNSELSIGGTSTRFQRVLDCKHIVVGEDSFVRLKIECDLEWRELIRNISQSWIDFVPGAVMLLSGDVTINSTFGAQKKSQIHRIPLFAEVIPGAGIELPPNVTVFYPNSDEVTVGMFYLRNSFECPVVVTGIKLIATGRNVAVEHPVFAAVRDHLKSAAEEFPKLLRAGESWTISSQLIAVNLENVTVASFSALIQIATNVTEILSVPLFGYSGRLTRLLLSNEVGQLIGKSGNSGRGALKESDIIAAEHIAAIDFGVIPLDEESHKYVALWNDNPVPIELKHWNLVATNILLISISSVGCTSKFDFAYTKDAQLQPDEWCVFQFSTTSTHAGEFNGVFQFNTNVETTDLPIQIVAHTRTLTVDPSSLVLHNCFPKFTCHMDLDVKSTYSEPVILHEFVTSSAAHLFTREIQPNAVTKVGVLFFTPRLNTVELTYTNTYPNKIFESTNAHGLMVWLRTAITMFTILQERGFQLPFQLITDAKKFTFAATVNFIWPKIIARRDGLKEHIIMSGQQYAYNISLYNPTEESIGFWYFLTDDRHFTMSLSGIPLALSNCADCLSRGLGQRIMSTTGKQGMEKFVLRPNEFRNITIRVNADKEPGSYASVFVLKNNFTFFEGSWQKVKIVQPQFKFGNRKPFSATPLLFEVPDQPSACLPESHASSSSHSLISTKRVFTAKNGGLLPLSIRGISIDSEPCSGYGFIVSNCAPFLLAPNETHKIEISFVPDFTVSRIERKLKFHLDIEYPIVYILVGVLPHLNMLERCSRSVDRPWWEAGLKKWALSMLATMAIMVATAAFFESLKILKDHSDATYRQRGPFQAPLDFKKLATTKTQPSYFTADGGTITPKETVKQPKRKGGIPPPSNIFNEKRFSWFINRAQSKQEPDQNAQVANDKKQPLKTVDKVPDRPTAPAAAAAKPSVLEKVALPAAESNKKQVNGTKKDGGATKKSKGKNKSLPQPKSAEVEQKVRSKAEQLVVKPEQQHLRPVTPADVPVTTPAREATKENICVQESTTYGKTPGRERKEKLGSVNRTAPSRANKVALFQQPHNGPEATPVPEPWMNTFQPVFQDRSASATNMIPEPVPPSYTLPDHKLERRYRQPPLDHTNVPAEINNVPHLPAMTEGGFLENPLGAIGTLPPTTRSYSLFNTETPSPLDYVSPATHGFQNSAPQYNHQTPDYMPNPNYYPQNGFDSANTYLSRNQSQVDPDFYERVALFKLWFMQRRYAQASGQSQAPTPDYTTWDQWRNHQPRQSQNMQPDLTDFINVRGPPPGLGPQQQQPQQQQQQQHQLHQHNHQQNLHGGSGGNVASDEDYSYDPFRSIWNQWNPNQ